MLTDVFGIKHAYEHIRFEEKVKGKFIDAVIDIPGAGVYIEHKSSDVDLDTKQRQSDGSMLTPYEQAKNYSFGSRFSKEPDGSSYAISESFAYMMRNLRNQRRNIRDSSWKTSPISTTCYKSFL